ncbi:hypothetical protein MCOR25_010867 [Pyricularia grisea]|nr:hypothetical protein MCOR25_010867 [Pyricularia grisea]
MASQTFSQTPVLVISMATRKPGMSLAEFKRLYETKHAPLVTSLVARSAENPAEIQPLTYTRCYVDDTVYPGAPPVGVPRSDYDCVSFLTFRSVQHRDEYFKEQSKHTAAITEDAKAMADVEKILFVTGQAFDSRVLDVLE